MPARADPGPCGHFLPAMDHLLRGEVADITDIPLYLAVFIQDRSTTGVEKRNILKSDAQDSTDCGAAEDISSMPQHTAKAIQVLTGRLLDIDLVK